MDALNELMKRNIKFTRSRSSTGRHHRERQNSEETTDENPANTAAEAAWAKILEAMEKRDDQMVTGWKDEMNNLLIFAGLFSAVVTAFAAGSYQSLQPDDQGTSVQILFRISQQLSSLAVTPGFVNSTVESAELPPFTPEPLAVQVNTFWFLSLALSLVAALFAIVVQQWLREYPVSGLRTVRECLRLRHFRYTNLNAWAVPHIVSILPILLQVALVLFLVGLAEFLWTLNHTVAWPFIVFLAVSVGFLLFTTLIPSMSASCPYKSPLAEIIILAVRSLVHASSLAIKAAASVVLTLAILSITGLIQVQHLMRLSSSYLDYRRQGLLNRLTRILIPSTWPFTLSQSTKRVFSEYWTTCDEDVVRDKEGLDQDILIWAPSALPSNQWSQIHPCLQDRTRDEVIECVTQLVTQSFNVSGQTSPSALRYPATLALRHMDRVSVEQCREYLFGAFLNTEQDGGSAVTRPPVSARLEVDSHLVLYFLMCAQPRPNSAMRVSYIQMLFDARKELRALGSNDSMYAHSRLRIVTSALLECSTAWEHVFSLEDTMVMSSWASDVWTRVPLGPAQFWVDQACGEEFFGTMALALYAMEQHSSQLTLSREVHDCCQGLLHCLDIYASTNAHRLRALVGESVHVTFANDGFMDAACASVCRSLGALACELAPEFQAVARAAADRLGDIFDGLACFRNAAECLDVFRARVSESNKEAPLAALPTVSRTPDNWY